MTVKITIPIEPMAKQSAKHGTRNGIIYSYQPAKITAYKQAVGLHAKKQYGGKPITGGIYVAKLHFIFPYPTAWNEKKRKLNKFKTTRPDIDNLIKAIWDGLQEIVFENDSQICAMGNVMKLYGDKPRTEIELESIE